MGYVERAKEAQPGFQGQCGPLPSQRLALTTVKGQETVAQLAAWYEVHPGQIQAWKKALVEGASGVFSNGKEQKGRNDAALIARLYRRSAS